MHDPIRPNTDELIRTVEDIGYNVTHAVWESYGVAINDKWALHTRGLVMSPVAAGALAFDFACHLGHHPVGSHALAILITLITVVTEWIVLDGVRIDIKTNAPGLEVSALGLVLKLQLAAFIMMFLGMPLVWLSKELHFELLLRNDELIANMPVGLEVAPDGGNTGGSAHGDRFADVPPSDGRIEMPRCRTPPPPLGAPRASPSDTSSRSRSPSPPRTPPAQIRRGRRTWDMETVEIQSGAPCSNERESIGAADAETGRPHDIMIGGGAANDFLEPTEVPTGPRPVPADMTPPRARVAQWRQTTTDAVDPRDLPRWNHDAPAE